MIENRTPSDLEKINKAIIDFGEDSKKELKKLFYQLQNQPTEKIDDGFMVEIRLKDPSIYAYAPLKFAAMERRQIQKITDDLLERGIIQLSVSPYCARVIPVRKRNGLIRLYADLRPLYCRIEKQKFPFPIIEKCLTRLGNKSVFTLLDLKDSFHQIDVHLNSTKYFAFATPDG